MFNKNKFIKFIVDNGVVGFFEQPIKLKSGRLSHWYVNWRTITEDVFLTEQLSEYIIDFVETKKLEVDTYFGVPEGATKIGLICQYKHAKKQKNFSKGSHTFAMGRGKIKEHGDPKDRYFLGVPKGRTVVIEDVTTTGSSLIETINKLKEAKVDIVATIGLTNRMEKRDDNKSVEEILKEIGISYYALSEATEILPLVAKAKKISEEIKKNVVEYFKKYGTKEVIL